MTSPAPSGGSSPLRIGGFVLVALAVIAAVVGLFTLATNGSSNSQPVTPTTTAEAASPSTAVQPPGTIAPTAPATSSGMPIPSYTPPPIAAPPPPAGGSSIDGGSSGANPNSSARSPLRVYNNSLIKGLADRAAGDFRAGGWQVDEVGNYPDGIIPTSTVFYRPDEQAAAQALGSQFGLQVEPRSDGLKSATDGLIVIVTKDYSGGK